MKKNLAILSLVFILAILHSCKKEELPTLSTSLITNITATSAVGGGNITSDGNASVSSRGICWSLNANPTISDSKTSDGTGIGQFISNMTGLNAGTTYHVRAYATNSVGTVYGTEMVFATLGKAPDCLTQAATNITSSGATLNGTVNANYLSTTVTFEYGGTTTYGQTVTILNPIIGNSLANVCAVISNLNPGTTYHFRIIGTNSIGTTNGTDMTFTTGSVLPTLTTSSISNKTSTTATAGGTITSDGGAVIIERGVCWATTPNPTILNYRTSDGIGIGTFISNITGLTPSNSYYARAYATNSVGTAYGNEMSFSTNSVFKAIVLTTSATSITTTSAVSGGTISSDGGGYIEAKGICWSTNMNPTILDNKTLEGVGPESFVSIITGLESGTVYYIRAYASNYAGTSYGEEFIISTSISDRELNVYKTVKIGTQIWLAENLKVTKYNDGENIPYGWVLDPNNNDWNFPTTQGYCWYNNDPSFKVIYGALYNWLAVNTGKLCPLGWHVPTYSEWRTLENFLSSIQINFSDGTFDLAKSIASNSGWETPLPRDDRGTIIPVAEGCVGKNQATNNKTGFNGFPSGFRNHLDYFEEVRRETFWWTATGPDIPWAVGITFDSYEIHNASDYQRDGFSVRCLKD